jgi:hypothetical protein
MTTVEKVLNIYNFSMSGGEKNLWISMIKNKQATLDQFKAVIEEKIKEKSNKSKPNNPVIKTTRVSSTKPMRVKKPCNCGKGKNKDWSSWDK